MKISSLFLGNELLNGQTTNVNVITLGQMLSDNGYLLDGSQTIKDDMEDIQSAIKKHLGNSDVLVLCGGLGPTEDDITRKAVAKTIGLETGFSEEVCQGLRAYMKSKGKTPSEDYYQKQAEVIIGAEVLKNFVGLAPGLYCSSAGTDIFLLPGPPREFNPMVEKTLIPFLQNKFPAENDSILFHLMGLSETRVENALQPFLKKYDFITPAYCANLGHVKMTINFPAEQTSLKESFTSEIKQIYGNHLVQSADMIKDIAELLESRNFTLATAESCTGGGIGHAITAFAGSSSFFMGSINTYANEWKVNQLGVKKQTLVDHGAVSEECASEMVAGLCERYKADCGIAVTGIAGPGGGSEEKPVGLVYIATQVKGISKINRYTFGGNRKEVREQTIRYALNQLRLQLSS